MSSKEQYEKNILEYKCLEREFDLKVGNPEGLKGFQKDKSNLKRDVFSVNKDMQEAMKKTRLKYGW